MKLIQVLLAVDQLFNALFSGMADEALSARAFRCELKGSRPWALFRRFVDALFFWQTAHCYHAWRQEINRAQLPSEYRLAEPCGHTPP